jgi:hypothetical protein
MITKTTKTILFVSLIVAMILPFSGTELANAETIYNDKTLTAKENSMKFSNWAKLLMTTNEYKSLSDNDKIIYLDFVKSMLDDSDPYQRETMSKIEQLSQAVLYIQTASAEQDVSAEKNRKSVLIEELEDLGVVSDSKFSDNPEYWMEKVRQAKEARGSYDVKRVSGQSNESEYTLIHTGDVGIRREANTFFPCFPGHGGPIICSTTGMDWGPGTSSTWGMALLDGNGSTNVFTCLENDVDHTTVSWYMSGSAKHIFNIGTTDWSKTYPNTKKTVSGSNNYCVGWVETDFLHGLDRLESSVTMSNPTTVTGQHA